MNQPLSRRGWSQTAASVLGEDPVLFAGGGQNNDFHVVYSRLPQPQLRLGQERPVVSQLLKEHQYGLFIFSNQAQDHWHFVNVKYDADTQKRRLFRRITIGPEERLRTAAERIAKLDLQSLQQDISGLPPLTIQDRHDAAFDVEAVTGQFHKGYEVIFNILQTDLVRQTKDESWSHDYSLQFLSRCMFLYFIQRKGWLGANKEFLASFWNAYRRSAQPADTFVGKWLRILFFEAFNEGFHGGYTYFPDVITNILFRAPFLNGGLFTESKLDLKCLEYRATIKDDLFFKAFEFFERYNFTIAEDSPLDKEVAVDPEMIGKVYESQVNISDEEDERGKAGIFYTPRTEIDLMCRLALVDNLANHLGEERKELLYQVVFALEPDEKQDADAAVAAAALWPQLNKLLNEITVLDPACGSGSFLVGMLHILDDLQERAGKQLGKQEDPYQRKKRIIGQSLYGVDTKEWACHVAELRLWLALVVDAEFTPEQLQAKKIAREPLLPYFSFKIRCGDSLVQEVGGVDLGHLSSAYELPKGAEKLINDFKDEKLKFYNNDSRRSYKTEEAVKQREKGLIIEVLDLRQKEIVNEINKVKRKVEGPEERQIRLDGTMPEQTHQIALDLADHQKRIADYQAELELIASAKAAVRDTPGGFFIWDIAFVEIFQRTSKGFDILIGNPPYVRHEDIAAPVVCGTRCTDDKREYKAKLANAVYRDFENFFRKGKLQLDARSDLYIFFYFRGLKLLNPKGSFCFITSNSWLDVGYGADLQEFLLKHCHVKMVLDNQLKRTFARADVNSIIALFSAPDDRREWGLEKTARFVMFRVPFEHIVDPVIFDELEEATGRKATREYRIFPIQQDKLLEDGCDVSDVGAGFVRAGFKPAPTGPLIKTARYIGNKWGGKYLRAPDIYWTILEKGKGKLVRLGDIAEVRRGFTTGANEFFYLDDERIREWKIEEEFLANILDTPRECNSIRVAPESCIKLFLCSLSKRDLVGTNALEYVKWGESKGFHKKSTCQSRGVTVNKLSVEVEDRRKTATH